MLDVLRNSGKAPRFNEAGAALAEFAISLPLLVIMTFGLFETGRLIAQIPWVAQTLYEVALEGAESPESLGQARMQSILEKFEAVLNSQIGGLTLTTGYETINVGGNSEKVVRASIGGTLIQLVNWTPYGLNVEFVAPHIANETVIDNPDQFETLGNGHNCALQPGAPDNTPCFNVPAAWQ